MLYRIYTENLNQTGIEELVSLYFDGFTLLEGTGFWKGEAEESLVVELVATEEEKSVVDLVAQSIKKLNTQQAVLVQMMENENYFI